MNRIDYLMSEVNAVVGKDKEALKDLLYRMEQVFDVRLKVVRPDDGATLITEQTNSPNKEN